MLAGFSVDVDSLDNAGRGVADLMRELEHHKVSALACESHAVGHERLKGVLDSFCDRWQAGVRNLSHDGKELADRLTASSARYGEVEQSVEKAIRSIMSEQS